MFIKITSNNKTVESVLTPTKITLTNNNKRTISNKRYCLDNIEAFSLDMTGEFIHKYSKKYNLSYSEMIGLGYLAQEFAQNTLLNKKINLKLGTKVTKDCEYATISTNGINYIEILKNSGYGIENEEIANIDKFRQNLENVRKLNLVTLNHNSNKYHTLECPYGEIAHDKTIIPKSQLPEGTIPCKFCNLEDVHKTKTNNTKHKNGLLKIILPQTTITSGDITCYNTDFTQRIKPKNECSSQACKRLLEEINNSKSTIDMALYGYSEIPEISKALILAKARGVEIRFIHDSYHDEYRNHYKDNSIIANLSTRHRSDKTNNPAISNMLMHNKFIIFDRKIVYTGSMNLSSSGASGFDVNNIIVINSSEIAELFTNEFEQMLSGKFHTEKQKLSSSQRFKLGESDIEIYFSPKDNTPNKIIERINDAQKYIYIPTFLITHSKIANALIEAHNKGVDVRIIIDANSVNTKNTKHALLRKAGILLKTENYAGKLHSKSMIIDDTYLITGSMNFSNSGAYKNDENLLIIKNTALAKSNKDFFLYLWTTIPNKYLNQNAKPESTDSIGSCTDGIDNNYNNKIDSEEPACVN